jgi:signal transduction histidine kinase
MTELRPAALEEFGLVPALRSYAAEFSKRTGIKISTSLWGRETRLPRNTELTLFRIVQEALTNAAKHSGGKAVEIKIAEQAGRIRLSVEDDGRGFTDSAAARGDRRGGWGLAAMRERAEALGGTLHLEVPARGVRLVVELPAVHAD